MRRGLALLAAVFGCAPQAPTGSPEPPAGEALVLVASTPDGLPAPPGTTPTHTAWAELIDGAASTIDLEHFYLSTADRGRLSPLLDRLEAAVRRGVRVRLLLDALFAGKYPEGPERLRHAGVELRQLDLQAVTGGVQHAKYLLIDRRRAYVGSANLDWRSLEHTAELGVRLDHPDIAGALSDIFERDWAAAGGGDRPAPSGAPLASLVGGERVTVVASPARLLDDPRRYELEHLLRAIGSARRSVIAQSLGYRVTDRESAPFPALDQALRQAAARGVRVELCVSDWAKEPGEIEPLQALAAIQNVSVRMVTVPPHPSGFIPYARVIHAKYVVVDDAWTWIGSSNLGGDYFLKSRNVGLVIESRAMAARVRRHFAFWAGGRHAYPVDPTASYQPPKIAPNP